MANLEINIGDSRHMLHAEKGKNLLHVLRREHIFVTADCNGTGTCGKCKVKISDHTKRTFREVLSCRTEVFDGMMVEVPESKLSMEEVSSSKVSSSSGTPSNRENPFATRNPYTTINPSVLGKYNQSASGIAVDLGTTTIAANLIRLSDGSILASCQEWNLQIPYGADVISRMHYIMQHEDGLQTLSEIVRKQIEQMVHSLYKEIFIQKVPVMISGNTIMQHIYAGIDPSSMATAPYIPATLFDEDSSDFTHVPSIEDSSDSTHIPSIEDSSDFTHVPSIEDSSDFTYIPSNEDSSTFTHVPSKEPASLEYHLTPCISAFIGGDITAGLYDTSLYKKEGNWLFLDIGTNGEMALGGKDGFLCASVATGPAFEGAQIACGCYGREGAVSHVRWDLLRRELAMEVIGDDFSINNNFSANRSLSINNNFSANRNLSIDGICGSGLIDLLAVLTELGIISKEGRIISPSELEERIEEGLVDEDIIAALENQLGIDFLKEDSDGNGVFYLNFDSETPVYLCTKDVHNLQLAKASVRAGIELLLKEKDLTPDHLDGIILAGGFGSHLNVENLVKIGMLPPGTGCKILQAGNTSLHGAGTYLMDYYQSSGIEAFDSKNFDSEVLDSEVLDSEALDSEVLDSEVLDSEALDSEVLDSEASAHRKLLHIQELCNYIELADTDEFADLFIQYLPLI